MTASDRDLRQAGERIAALLDDVRGAASAATWQRVDELVRLLVEVYGAGLARLLAAVPQGDPLERLLDDDLVASLLVLHDIHPLDPTARIERALARVRPYLGSHEGDVELVGLDDDGVVRLRLRGSCDGCPSSAATVSLAIEKALREAVPEVTRIDVEGSAAPRVPIVPSAPRWNTIPALELQPGRSLALDVDGARILVCRLDGGWYAYRNACPACDATLDAARLDGPVLACPACDGRFDVRLAGRSVGDGAMHLDPVPLLAGADGVRVAIAEARA